MTHAAAVNAVLASYTCTPELLFQRLDANQFKLHGLVATFQQCNVVVKPEFVGECAEQIADRILALAN